MLELINLSNYRTDLELIHNDADELAALLFRNGLDGLEMMFCDPWEPSLHRREWIHGVHLQFWPSWLEFWRGDMTEVLRQFGTEKDIVTTYGGLNRQDWLGRCRANIAQAVAAEAEYVVFHVCHNRLDEVYGDTFSATDETVVEAALEVLNELTPDIPAGTAVLLENLWWPGLTLLNPRLIARLIGGIRHPQVGIMLDTGHLMNTCLELRSQKAGIDYILAVLKGMGPWRQFIQGIHLHYSLSGDYVRKMRREAGHPHTLAEAFSHVMAIDQHCPFTVTDVGRIVQTVNPKWLVHEFVQKSASDWEAKIRLQRQALTIGLKQ